MDAPDPATVPLGTDALSDFAALAPGGSLPAVDRRADRTFWGHLVESAVGAHLVNTSGPEYRLYYWRDRGREVDFVLEHGRKLVAFEVKSCRRRGNVRGLEAFGKNFPVEASHIVGKGGIPVSEFLLTPAREWFEGS